MKRKLDYRQLSVAGKQRAALEAQREPPLTCPGCGTQAQPGDLLAHALRCEGPREPHPRSRWVTSSQVQALGVPRQTLSFWAARGSVRSRGERLDRLYLFRDVVLRLADRRASIQQSRMSMRLDIRRKGRWGP